MTPPNEARPSQSGGRCSCGAEHDGWIERVSAWLAYKLGKRPSDALLAYCADYASTRSLRREAARLLAKRVKARV